MIFYVLTKPLKKFENEYKEDAGLEEFWNKVFD